MRVKFVDLERQYHEIKPEIDSAIQAVISMSAFVKGEFVESFERNFADYLGVKYCVGVGSGTDALAIALRALEIDPWKEVIVPANSFIATSEAVTMAGAKPVFVDCHPETYNIDHRKLEKAFTDYTEAIIPVHLYGQPADMSPILKFAKKWNLYVIEDAAQAHGAIYSFRNVGTLGDIGCFSFYPAKNLGAYGDGGAIVTNDSEIAREARMYADHGRFSKYEHEFQGVNSRLDGIQAAVLDVKLRHLEAWILRRRAIAKIYDEGLMDVVQTPKVHHSVKHVYHLYVIKTERREALREFLSEAGIETGIHYPAPLPLLKAYEYMNHKAEEFPASCALAERALSLPIHGSMSDSEAEYVVKKVKEFFNDSKRENREA